MRVKLRAVRFDETPKRVLVAPANGVQQRLLSRGRAFGRGGHSSGD
jgi:hypothetical protein